VSALVTLLIVAALATAGAWAWELKHERLRKDMDDGASSDQAHPDAEPFAVSLANPDADQRTAP
jgi:hypothetical protein